MYYLCENINIDINININILWEQLETIMNEDFQLLDPPFFKIKEPACTYCREKASNKCSMT